MITLRTCDLCERPLVQEFAQFEIVRGEVGLLSRQRWEIVARPSGMMLRTICRECCDYIESALRYLTEGQGTPV